MPLKLHTFKKCFTNYADRKLNSCEYTACGSWKRKTNAHYTFDKKYLKHPASPEVLIVHPHQHEASLSLVQHESLMNVLMFWHGAVHVVLWCHLVYPASRRKDSSTDHHVSVLYMTVIHCVWYRPTALKCRYTCSTIWNACSMLWEGMA